MQQSPDTPDNPNMLYRFHIQAQLADHWSAWFDGLTFIPQSDGTSYLEGALVDQSALYGVIGRLRDLGITLLAVQQVDHADSTKQE